MPAYYDPNLLRKSLLRSAANTGTNATSSAAGGKLGASEVNSEGKSIYNGKTIEEWRAEQDARREFRSVSPEYRLAQEELGLDPNRDLELLLRDDKSLGSNIRAGAEDAALGLAEMGAYLYSKVPSPKAEKFASQKDIISARRKLLKSFMQSDEEGKITPGGVLSASSEFANPAGKAKWLNAGWHALRGMAENGVFGGTVSGGSNLAGEAAEEAGVKKALQTPKVAALATKIPAIKRLSGLPGNAAGSAIERLIEYLSE